MFYEDLSLYEYATYFGVGHHMPLPNVFNVGWLEDGHEFSQGDVDQPTLDILKHLLDNRDYNCLQFRGYHHCDLCDVSDMRGEVEEKRASRGSSNVLIPSPSGKIYAAPSLIYHYIVEHHYRPPEEFLEAVRQYDPNLEWDGKAVYWDLVHKRRAELGEPPERP